MIHKIREKSGGQPGEQQTQISGLVKCLCQLTNYETPGSGHPPSQGLLLCKPLIWCPTRPRACSWRGARAGPGEAGPKQSAKARRSKTSFG